MRITVELPESDLRDICRFTGIRKKGPAIRHLVEEALKLERRREVAGRFLSGEWGTDLAGFEKGQAADQKKARTRSKAWRD